jgi:nascent polypeptide-associated complex subunit beta
VNLFKDDGDVIHFSSPKVQASIGANTYVISGACETKKLQDLLPGIINQLGPDNLQHLKNIAESYSASAAGAEAEAADTNGDESVPEFVDFESVSQAMD